MMDKFYAALAKCKVRHDVFNLLCDLFDRAKEEGDLPRMKASYKVICVVFPVEFRLSKL